MIQRFLRNKVVEVEPRPDGTLEVSWRLTDDLLKAEVRTVVQLPDMEILEADAKLDRFLPQGGEVASELIKKIEGINIGGGLRKIVAGLLGGPDGCPILVTAILESANAVILHFTRPGLHLSESMTDPTELKEGFQFMLQTNPRLVRSCIAFQDDSPLMEGLNL